MREISRACVRFIAGWEGFSPTPYRDSAGVWTIGYGETESVGPNTPRVTRRQARKQLKRRLNEDFAPAIRRAIRTKIRQREFDALCSFTYNLGVGALQTSTMLRRLNETDDIHGRRRRWRARKRVYREELPKWVNAGGNRLQGLVKRRAAEVRVAVYGDYSGRP